MSENKIWESPDSRIKKVILESGPFGPKPTENAICSIEVTEIKFKDKTVSEYLDDIGEKCKIIIGEANTAIDREIDKLLLTMNKDEVSNVTIKISTENVNTEISFNIKLIDFESNGLYYQWTCEEKCKMALRHKEKGIDLFRNNRFIDASHRFSKALKLLLSIPIPVDEVPEKIENILLSDLENYKANLYNNLSSCYAKLNLNDSVIELCTKVLDIDKENSKAFFKRGVAFTSIKEFEKAKCDLNKVLEYDSDNKAVLEKLQFINLNLNKQEADYATIVKKMFSK